MGLFTLVACSEDSYQEADKMNESGAVENGSGGNIKPLTVDPAIPYESPFDMSNGPCCTPVQYVFINNTEWEIEVSTGFGLAKYDGDDDLWHFGWPMNPASNYPTFFIQNNLEYFELLYSTYKTIPQYTTMSSGITGAQVPISSTASTFFTLGSFTVPHHPAEASLLYEYGKAFTYHVIVKNPITNIQVLNTYVNVPFLPYGVFDPNLLSSEWLPLINARYPYGALWYNKNSLEICFGNSSESTPSSGGHSRYIFKPYDDDTTFEIKSTINSKQIILSLDKI